MRKMKRSALLYTIDILMLINVLLLIISTVLIWPGLIFPLGYFRARIFWIEIHKWSGLSLGVLAAVHVFLHFKWLKNMTKKYLRKFRFKKGD